MALMVGACAETSVRELSAPDSRLPSPAGATHAATGPGAASLAASPESLMRLADATRAAGHNAAAASLYFRASLAAPQDADLQAKVGYLLYQLGAYAEADGAFRRALAIAPRNAEALRGLGITLVARDMPHHAIEQFEQAVAVGSDPRAYNALGVARDMVGDRAGAQAAYRAGLAHAPDNLALQNNLGLSLALSGNYEDAISVLGQAVTRPDATARQRQNLALAYGLYGRPDKAAEVSNQDLAMSEVRNNLGYYAWLRNQPVDVEGLGATFTPAEPAESGVDAAAARAAEQAYAPPPPLSERGAAAPLDGAIGPPVAVAPPATAPTTPVQATEATDSGVSPAADATTWELIGVVDETPPQAKAEKAAGKTPQTAAKPAEAAARPAPTKTVVDPVHGEDANLAREAAPVPAEPQIESIDEGGNDGAYNDVYDGVDDAGSQTPAADLRSVSEPTPVTVDSGVPEAVEADLPKAVDPAVSEAPTAMVERVTHGMNDSVAMERVAAGTDAGSEAELTDLRSPADRPETAADAAWDTIETVTTLPGDDVIKEASEVDPATDPEDATDVEVRTVAASTGEGDAADPESQRADRRTTDDSEDGSAVVMEDDPIAGKRPVAQLAMLPDDSAPPPAGGDGPVEDASHDDAETDLATEPEVPASDVDAKPVDPIQYVLPVPATTPAAPHGSEIAVATPPARSPQKSTGPPDAHQHPHPSAVPAPEAPDQADSGATDAHAPSAAVTTATAADAAAPTDPDATVTDDGFDGWPLDSAATGIETYDPPAIPSQIAESTPVPPLGHGDVTPILAGPTAARRPPNMVVVAAGGAAMVLIVALLAIRRRREIGEPEPD